jgi:uncharacterized iron-regulated protein
VSGQAAVVIGYLLTLLVWAGYLRGTRPGAGNR